jgi:hypothetical protein
MNVFPSELRAMAGNLFSHRSKSHNQWFKYVPLLRNSSGLSHGDSRLTGRYAELFFSFIPPGIKQLLVSHRDQIPGRKHTAVMVYSAACSTQRNEVKRMFRLTKKGTIISKFLVVSIGANLQVKAFDSVVGE